MRFSVSGVIPGFPDRWIPISDEECLIGLIIRQIMSFVRPVSDKSKWNKRRLFVNKFTRAFSTL